MSQPSVSIVVCTYNRAPNLDRCLNSLEKQDYPDFEIIVVNGPSTDNTDEILDSYPDIQIIKQDSLNGLSFARNLGAKAANGDIIAFIDDDAVADESWISCLVKGYANGLVGGVGGPVFDITGKTLQFKNGYVSRSGNPTFFSETDLNYNDPNGDFFNYLMGTNASFRKSVLFEAGLFDPEIKYYLDETDLCVRVIKAGYRIRHMGDAIVLHEMAEGHNRKSMHDLNWYEVTKNTIYFILKNFDKELSTYTVRPIEALYNRVKYFIQPYFKKEISTRQLFCIYGNLIKGTVDGYLKGLKTDRHSAINNHSYNADMLTICLVSQEFSKSCNGGICRYTYDLAHELTKLGNEVHVISKSEDRREYEFQDGEVYVHKITPKPIDFIHLSDNYGISKKNLDYSYSICLKLLDLRDRFGIQIAEVPLWDAEGFAFSLIKKFPLIVRIETPLFKVAEIQGWPITSDLKLANWMEGETARNADRAIAISNAIGELISKHHSVPQERIKLCPLGIELKAINSRSKNGSQEFNILFVGRLETRKGLDTLFKSIPLVADRIPNSIFSIVGKDTNLAPGGGSYKDYLLAGLEKKYHKNVKFLGYIRDLDNCYRDCDVFVAPSLYESFGLIYLEAMAWGKPVIGCNVGGVPEVIDDGVTGILVPPDDEISLAKALIKLEDVKLRTTMGENGRNRMESTFSVKKMAMESFEIYKETIAHS